MRSFGSLNLISSCFRNLPVSSGYLRKKGEVPRLSQRYIIVHHEGHEEHEGVKSTAYRATQQSWRLVLVHFDRTTNYPIRQLIEFHSSCPSRSSW